MFCSFLEYKQFSVIVMRLVVCTLTACYRLSSVEDAPEGRTGQIL